MLNSLGPAFGRGRDLLKRLQDLNGAGKHESSDADAARADLDDLWPELNHHEARLLSELSGDLYSFSDEEAPDPELARLPKQELLDGLKAAYPLDPQMTLRLLRGGPNVPPDSVAYVRARCWERLGDLDIALWFLEHAERKAPPRNRHGALILNLLARMDRQEDAVRRADRYLASPETDTQVSMIALHTLFTANAGDPAEPDHALAERTVVHAHRLLTAYRDAVPDERNPHWGLITAHHAAASDHVINRRPLRESYDQLCRAFDLDVVWTAYGLDLRDIDADAAEIALLRAIDLNTRLMWPYRHLAFRSLEKNAFSPAIGYARDALSLATNVAYKAEANACLALAYHGLRAPDETVDHFMLLARHFDPTNEGIEDAYRSILQERKQATHGPSFRLGQLPTKPWQISAGEIAVELSAA